MYLEGSDQHRGWFQSSLLTSVATQNRAPYKTVLTHGFVVDEAGKKMSKSVGNVVDPDDVIKQYGADVLRLWVASVNYTDDIPIGKNMLAQLAEVYRKLRNTARYLLGNLYDFDPEKDRVPLNELSKLDAFVLHRLHELVVGVTEDFDRYEFFKYYQLLQNFCVVDLSSFYFDIVKDRLYVTAPKSVERRSVQTVLEQVLQVLVRLLVPVTPHLAEDIWQHTPERLRKASTNDLSVLLSDFPVPDQKDLNQALDDFWTEVIPVRNTVNKALEQARADKKIGKSVEAKVLLHFDKPDLAEKVASLGKTLPSIFIVSQAEVTNAPSSNGSNGGNGKEHAVAPIAELSENGVKVTVLNADGEKCARCWKYSTKVGADKTYSDVCDECAEALPQFDLKK
jgi:isoleucyl-tRNA synthetase